MMDIVFFLKVQITILAGYLLYHAVFRSGVSLMARRIYLLALPVFAVLISSIEQPAAAIQGVLPLMEISTAQTTILQPISYAAEWPWYVLAYVSIACILAFIIILQLFMVIWRLRRTHAVRFQDHTLIEHDSVAAPFSFFRFVCLPVITDADTRAIILQHERTHVRQWHSADVLYLLIVRAVCWMNPAAWLMLREMRLVHECLADATAARGNTGHYAELLVARHFQTDLTVLHNAFYQPSQIQQRLMALQTTAPVRTWLRVCMLLPVMAIMGLINVNAQSVTNETTLDKVEKMPEYPGGNDALMQYLVSSMQYPAEASKNSIQGVVYVEFTVKKNGKVSNVNVKKSVHPDLDAEAVRVISNMPDWTPGEVDGKKADFDMMLPIRFALN